ncbi:hypothetical protein KUCAC02_028522, partial [Chaenocephalus aceratus]
ENSPSNSRGLRLQRQKRETALQPFSLHWHGRVCHCAPLFSSIQYSPHGRVRSSHTASPSECVVPGRERE